MESPGAYEPLEEVQLLEFEDAPLLADTPAPSGRTPGGRTPAGRKWSAVTAHLSGGTTRTVLMSITAWHEPAGGNLFVRPQYRPAPPDADNPNSDVALYELHYREGDEVRDLCPFDEVTGGHTALFLRGLWTQEQSSDHVDLAAFKADTRGVTVACTTGVLAKCTLWGYKPWAQARDAAGHWWPLDRLHRACVRAARADYCGDGEPHTTQGRRIQLFDSLGFIAPDPTEGLQPEASYGERGAGCVGDSLMASLPACTPGRADPMRVMRFADDVGRQRCMKAQGDLGEPQLIAVDGRW
jgi:hypothetical protein